MVVDDEEYILYLVGRILKKAGHEVITASSGEECLDILKTEKPDLILLDVMMPGLDGFKTCEAIKDDEENRSILIAMFTVKSSREHRLRSLEQCAADWHIAKSMDSERLVEIVNWLLTSPPRGAVRK